MLVPDVSCGPPADHLHPPPERSQVHKSDYIHSHLQPDRRPDNTQEPSDMTSRVSVQIFEEFAESVSPDWIDAVVTGVLSTEPEWSSERVSVVIANDESVAQLNHEHRGLDETTDVLSFSNRHSGQYYGEDDGIEKASDGSNFVLPPGHSDDLGEVIVSYPQVCRQAREAGHTAQKELAFMLAHGILHLLGYDHEREAEAAEMFSIQNRAMATLGDLI